MITIPVIEKIIERQVRSWDLRRKLAGEGGEIAREALSHLRQGPWLTVSRQLGSGGGRIGQLVGSSLGWEVYDHEILERIAEHTQTRNEVLSRLDSDEIGPFRDYIAQLIVPGDLSRAAFLREVIDVIWSIARQGHAVVLGRGANWFLDAQYGLRVRVIAPLEQRIAAISRSSRVPEDQARQMIDRHDDQRRSFVRQTFGRDVDDPVGYDLIVNTGGLDHDAAAAVILSALRLKLGSPE
jgi:hypothetical protein